MKTVEIFMQRSANLNFDFNIRTIYYGFTGFQIACINGRVEMLIQKSIEFEIELDANNAVG